MIPKGPKKIQEACGYAGIYVLKAHQSFVHPDENIIISNIDGGDTRLQKVQFKEES